jgi:hypothetical protein
MKYIFQFILLTIFISNPLLAQIETNEKISIKATLINAKTKNPIAFANVFNKKSKKGTITDMNGFFQLDGNHPEDIINFSFVGFKNKSIKSKDCTDHLILMYPSSDILNEIILVDNNSFLYDMIRKTRKSRSNKTFDAKTYYMVESFVGNKQVDQIERYYNGEFKSYDLESLSLKNGRIGISTYSNNRYFLTESSSKAIQYHKLFDENNYFPTSPFQVKKRKMMDDFHLSLVKRYKNEENSIVYVIEYEPKYDKKKFFEGQVWIDSNNNRILKVELKVVDAEIHPFTRLFDDPRNIDRVDLEITKTFTQVDNKTVVSSIDFNYLLEFEANDDSIYTLNSTAVLHAYRFKEKFIMPKTNVKENEVYDTRILSGTPMNQYFWDNIDEFKTQSITNRNSTYLEKEADLRYKDLFEGKGYTKKLTGMHERPYLRWHPKNRILFTTKKKDIDYDKAMATTIKKYRYKLEAILFMDINTFNDSVHVFTKSIFDSMESFYYFEIKNRDLAFINIYFDLVEIHRRKLEERLKGVQDIDEINKVYNLVKLQIKETTNQYFKDVDIGENKKQLKKWNKYVFEELGIDNLKIFPPEEDEDKITSEADKKKKKRNRTPTPSPARRSTTTIKSGFNR